MIKTLDQAPIPFQGTEIHTLPNGLTIVLKDDETTPVVAMQVWAECGAVNESPKIYGISHGLEHMVFKGTRKKTAGQITRAIESYGGSINAATQLETTHYYIDVPSYGAAKAFDVLADTIIDPIFPEDELERERLVILEEIHRRDDSPDATLWDEFASHIFYGTPYDIKVIGNEKTVSNLSRKDLQNYYQSHYVPAKLKIVITGDFRKGSFLKQIYSHFGNIQKKKSPQTPEINSKKLKPRDPLIIKRPVQLCYVAMGLPTVGLNHPDVVKLDVLADVICGGYSSRFYQKLREEEKVCVSVACDYISFRQQGLFSFFIETLPGSEEKAIQGVQRELNNLIDHPITDVELNRAKARIKSDWLTGAETPHGMASTLGTLTTLGQIDLLETYISKIDALTVDDLMDTFKQYVHQKQFSITQVQPQ